MEFQVRRGNAADSRRLEQPMQVSYEALVYTGAQVLDRVKAVNAVEALIGQG